MGSTQSVAVSAAEEEEESSSSSSSAEEEEEEEERERRESGSAVAMKKVLQQEPEMLPCHASASPLSPQLSSLGTPRIKVWDPYNVLAPPPPPPTTPELEATEVFLISQGQCQLSLTPDLIGGRCPSASLTPAGKRQARALAVFLNSQGVRFSAVYTSPMDRARSMAVSVCQEMRLAEEDIQVSEALAEMSQGQWEGCHRSETFSGEAARLMEPDFSAPSGETLRQVEFRMVEFVNRTLPRRSENHHHHHHNHNQHRKRSGKSRLQLMSTNHHGDDDSDGAAGSSGARVIGIFSHAVPIKCLLTGILGCGPHMSHKLCVDESSVTVLHHSWKTGWQIKKLNETAHLRLL